MRWNKRGALLAQISNAGCPVTRAVFASLLKSAWHSGLTKENLKEGFRMTGIYPRSKLPPCMSKELIERSFPIGTRSRFSSPSPAARRTSRDRKSVADWSIAMLEVVAVARENRRAARCRGVGRPRATVRLCSKANSRATARPCQSGIDRQPPLRTSAPSRPGKPDVGRPIRTR